MAQQPGTLVPGQSISVNKYTVQVERYLSQGGFAHVYLVRTATPVYNTTHHVLKRIAVANDAMLTEVKKEVDIMRLLKGHPNIVHLIDAAWHRMANGMYEVFILMEFCPGGGIIDMMNRRLRERLTEAEILQIFVDVCEGVAYMHNSRPPLLHRDLKVENILQSSATSFKLCDFGSATTVAPRPPATTQEIRALEADLNRHTTLQYRAPEMVDPYLRRPVDEKSDVWALGVLLYKLCYYTTPFEEHGPLAILNVQYRIPPYPVYSGQMNSLIASMLREHGAQRPSVFELLALVHRLRGTKSQFTYTIPAPQPLSPRPNQTQFSTSQTSNPLESTVTYRSQQQRNPNAGVQARDKVLEAIAPMRRGRPEPQQQGASPSRPRTSSPQKERTQPQPPQQPPQAKNWLDEEEKAWKAATVKSGTSLPKRSAMDDAWLARGGNGGGDSSPSKGFGDDFAEKLWDSLEPNGKTVKPSNVTSPPLRQPAFTGSLVVQRGGKDKDKDAFEGLGGLGSGEKPAPTLGEARLLRTGLAGTTSTHSYKYDGDYKDFKPGRPSPSPRPSYNSATPPAAQLLSPQPPALKPMGSGSSWLSQPPSSMSRPSSSSKVDGNDGAETRFPSLEELDKTFGSPPPTNGHSQSPQPPPLPARKESSPIPPAQAPREILRPTPSYGSPQLSNAALRDGALRNLGNREGASGSGVQQRPPLTRKHRSSLTTKHTYASDDSAVRMGAGSVSASALAPAASQSSQRDWLTGDDDDMRTPLASSHARTATTPAVYSTRTPATADYSPSPPVLRQSPSKRTSIIEKSGLHIAEAVVAQRDYAESSPIPNTPSSPAARAAHMFPALDLTSEPSDHGWGPSTQKDVESASSADEGPEDVNGFMSTPTNKGKTTQEVGRTKKKSRQSSVHDLVDLYGGSGLSLPSKEKERVSPSLLDDLTSRKSLVNDTPTETKAKRRSTALASVSTAKPPPSSSINSTLSPPNSGRPPPSPNSDKSSGAISPRSRPQSMFLFPSKSTDSTSSSTLSPPAEEPRMQRAHTRRTSISDMVQRYEAIGGSSVKARAPSPIPPPLSSKPTTISENGRYSVALKSSSSPSSSPINGRPAGSISLPISASSSTGLAEPPKTMTPRRVSPTGLPRTATPLREPEGGGLPPVRSRRTSYKSSFDTGGGGGGGSSGPPSRKGTVGDERERARDPSPERPYQGVGKLIDQWQRKTAETDRGPVGGGAKRGGGAGSGGFVAKRAGLVGKGGA